MAYMRGRIVNIKVHIKYISDEETSENPHNHTR